MRQTGRMVVHLASRSLEDDVHDRRPKDSGFAVAREYLGTWDVETTTQSPSAVGEVTAKWVLDGRFIQSSGFASPHRRAAHSGSCHTRL